MINIYICIVIRGILIGLSNRIIHTFKIKIKINKNNIKKEFVLLLFNIFINSGEKYKKNMTWRKKLSFIKSN